MIREIIKWNIIGILLNMIFTVTCYAVPSVDFSITWDESAERYRVFMKPVSVPSPNHNISAQVTIKAPYQSDANKFVVTDLVSTVADATWSSSSSVHAPTENVTASYLSFYVFFNKTDAYTWITGQEIEVFSFKNANTCLGSVNLIANDDSFNFPNSVGTTADNQITNSGWGNSDENHYRSNYNDYAYCSKELTINKSASPSEAVIGSNLVYSITVTNPSDIDATGIKVWDQLTDSISYISDDSSGAYDVTTGIWDVGTIIQNTSKTLQVTVLVN